MSAFAAWRRRRAGSLLRDERGVAAIEFSLLAVLVFTMLAAAVDMTQALIIQRDINRFTAAAAMVLATADDDTKVALAGLEINAKIANVLPGWTGVEVGSASIVREGSAIRVGVGTMTYMPPEANAAALAALSDKDHGVVVRASYRHEPIILGFAERFGLTTRTFVATTAALRLRNAQY